MDSEAPQIEIQSIVGKATPGEEPELTTETVSVDEALKRAVTLHQKGRQGEAQSLYKSILSAVPEHSSALHFLGILAYQAGKSAEAIELISKSLEVDPDYLDARNNLGNIHHELHHYPEAENAYREVLAIESSHTSALNNLAAVLKAQGHFEEAIEHYQSALANDPNNGIFHYNLGNAYISTEKWQQAKRSYEKAIEIDNSHSAAYRELSGVQRALGDHKASLETIQKCVELDESLAHAHCEHGVALHNNALLDDAILAYKRAIRIDPSYTRTYPFLVIVLKHTDQMDEAAEVAKRWLKLSPDNPSAKHLVASITGEDVPVRATDSYVTALFDDFSKEFDSKLQKLEYQAPQLIFDHCLNANLISEKTPCRIIDAGCGTGLCGPLFQPYASSLDGVDLSSGMLENAKQRNVYTYLEQAELTEYLASAKDDCDLIISADTLVYFGELDDAIAASSSRLVSGGWLAFSVEKLDENESDLPHRINPNGRYSHTRKYLQETLTSNGFNNLSINNGVLRQELGKPVNGYIVLAQNK